MATCFIKWRLIVLDSHNIQKILVVNGLVAWMSLFVTEEQAEAACAGLKDELDRKDATLKIWSLLNFALCIGRYSVPVVLVPFDCSDLVFNSDDSSIRLSSLQTS